LQKKPIEFTQKPSNGDVQEMEAEFRNLVTHYAELNLCYRKTKEVEGTIQKYGMNCVEYLKGIGIFGLK
jgi:hypothetical protein